MNVAASMDKQPLAGYENDYDPLLALIGDARYVLIGEASHGTHEFYQERAAITKRLIAEKGFTAVAVEVDWPGAYRVNRYVRGADDAADADAALGGFKRFPTWMWRNTVVRDFVAWLRAHNAALPDSAAKAGFWPRRAQARPAQPRRQFRGALPYPRHPHFLLSLRNEQPATALQERRLERAIGVVYRPETERQSHYFTARLAEQFDAVLHCDETRALEPLERTSGWEAGEPPETYPFAV